MLVVVSATDWMHGMNNDNLIGYLAEWLEDVSELLLCSPPLLFSAVPSISLLSVL